MASPAVRQRISISQAKPGDRERQLAGTRAAMARPEVRARISAATREGMARKFERQLSAIGAAWNAAPKLCADASLPTLERALHEIGRAG